MTPRSDGAADDVAVWNFGSTVTATDGTLLNASTYRVCIDRHTAEAVDCDSDMSTTTDEDPIEGLTLTFPFGTEKKRLRRLQLDRRSRPGRPRFEGEEKLEGLDVYRFQLSIPETVIRRGRGARVAGRLAHEPGVTADVVYSNERTIWVEPTSGVIVTSEEHPNTFLRGPDGTDGADDPGRHVRRRRARPSPTASKRAEDIRGQINLVSLTLPLLLAGLGLVSLIVGALLVRRGRGDDHREELTEETPAREPQVQ